MESDKEEAVLANTQTLTSEYEVTNKLDLKYQIPNMSLQKESNIATSSDKKTSENYDTESKQSVDKLNYTINNKESANNIANSEIQNKDAEENLIPVTNSDIKNNDKIPQDSLKIISNEININISSKENVVLIESESKTINRKKSASDNLKITGSEQNGLKIQVEIESKKSLTNEKSTGYSNMTVKASVNNNNKENDDRNLQLSISEGSAETADMETVDIKCEVDCDAMVDIIKDEIIDEDYNVPDNFMDLANHFLTSEARVVLQRIMVYKCPQCPRVFTSAGQRSMHKAKHVSEQVLTKLRNKENTSERFIKRHECPECDQRFVQESTLETHMVIHRPYPNVCHCGIGYTKLVDLQQHERIVHNKIANKTYTSTWRPVIKLKKTKRSEINRKRLKKEPEIREPTPEPTTSKYGRKQKRFINIRENSPKLEYSSDDLDDETLFQPKKRRARPKFKTPEQIQAEVERLIKNENKKLQKAENKARRLAIKQENANKGPFTCTICDKELKTYRSYEVHLQAHGNLRNYKCNVCEKAFNSATGLRNHEQTHLENQFKCSFCDKTFNNNHNRKNHENIHMGVKPYSCGYCDKSFTDPSAFKRHERTHTGVKPYKCEYCPKAFSDASAAIVHRRRHKGERKFACRLCDKTYIDKGARDIHEQLHANDYKFECDLCSSKFQLKQYLVFHMQRKHGNRSKIKCSLCHAKVLKTSINSHKMAVHGIKLNKKKELSVFNGPVEIEIDTRKELSSDDL